MLYQINDGVVSYGDDVILYDLDFEIRNNEKIAVVGRNGCGKTTLLKLIAGEIDLDIGDDNPNASIAKTGNPSIGYLSQIAFDDLDISLEEEIRKCVAPMLERKAELERLSQKLLSDHSEELIHKYTDFEERFREDGGYYFEKEYDVMIRKFGFDDEQRRKPLRDFSGGQQTKIAFIKLLLSKPDILLLDEPTNHLDVTAVSWLEGYIRDYPKAVVVVSHDRMFLDNTVSVVYEIEYGTAVRYPGNYSDFTARKKEQYTKRLKDYEAQQKEIARLEKMVEKFISHPTKVSMARSKQKAIERMELIERPDRYDNRTFHVNFKPLVQSGKDVLFIQDLKIGYDSVLSSVNLDLKSGERLGIVGDNGLGKSTFLKTIVDIIPPISGEFKFGTNAIIGYFDQQMAMYSSSKSVIDDYWDEFPSLTETEIRNDLGAFLFTQDDVFKKVDMLSGGEKVRLALCKIFKKRPNVLILDEPTNHMDIVGKETLESMLKEFEGTVIFVSHDRYFIKQVATQILEFNEMGTAHYRFGYDEYLQNSTSLLKNNSANSLFFGSTASSSSGSAASSSFGNGVSSSSGSTASLSLGNTAHSSFASEGIMTLTGTDSHTFGSDDDRLMSSYTNGQDINNRSAKLSYNLGKERSRLQKKSEKLEVMIRDKESAIDSLKAELDNPDHKSDYLKLMKIQKEIDEADNELISLMENWEECVQALEELDV